MWWTLVSIAAAEPASTCATASVVGFRPGDGSVVPPEVVVHVAFGDGCKVNLIELLDEQGLRVYAAESFVGELFVLEPFEPLAPGEYRIVDDYAAQEFGSFTVATDAEPPPGPPPPADLAVRATRSCEGALTSAVEVTATFDGADPDGWGFLVLDLTTEHGLQATTRDLWAGERVLTAEQDVFGGREVCAAPRLESWLGEELWAGDPVCAEPFEGCPADARPAPDEAAGCGCASTRAGWGGLGGLLLLLARFRRRP